MDEIRKETLNRVAASRNHFDMHGEDFASLLILLIQTQTSMLKMQEAIFRIENLGNDSRVLVLESTHLAKDNIERINGILDRIKFLDEEKK